MFLYGIIVKCYQGIVIGRYDYSTVRVRPTLSDITVIRSPVLATFLANRQITLNNGFGGFIYWVLCLPCT